ncbi:hypothetical protein F5I97DRAFT_807253 [Phlebopus sp. FC_14]|nr:hypothetical protein F5I97DRAFT_807253 [Phlebopus sp. FC_14]
MFKRWSTISALVSRLSTAPVSAFRANVLRIILFQSLESRLRDFHTASMSRRGAYPGTNDSERTYPSTRGDRTSPQCSIGGSS